MKALPTFVPGPFARHTVIETLATGEDRISVPRLPALGVGSTRPIRAICVRCERTQPRAITNPVLTDLYRQATGNAGPIYGSVTTCTACTLKECA